MGEIIEFAVFGAVDANQSFLVDYFLDLEAFLSVLGFSGMGENPLSKEASAKIKDILSSAFLVFHWQFPQQKVTLVLATLTTFLGFRLRPERGQLVCMY